MMARSLIQSIFISCLFYIILDKVSSHTHHLHNTQREREEDGAYSPRDKGHIGKDGEHDMEFDHESILGNSKDAEEFDHLSPSEAKRRLEILLKKMDRNSDLEIDRKELQSWILRSFRMLSEEESEDRREELDEDEDGYVTWEEYISETYGIEEPNDLDLLQGENKEQEQKLLKEDRVLFNAADANVDGRLDSMEFLAFSHPEENADMLPYLLKQTLADKDKNQDGYIDFQEFIGDKGQEKDKEWLLTEKDNFDNEYDKDGDGILNKEEILNWVVPSNEDIAEDEVDHLFGAADDDGDDLLSFGEILDHHDIFVGSEATDYGDHLHNLERFTDEL